MTAGKTLLKRKDGAVLLEFVLCFPILIVLFLFAMQLAQILLTWQVVHYAAYMGARSAMTANNVRRKSQAEKVAKRILAVVSLSPSDSKDAKDAKDRAPDEYSKLDGWGWLPGTKYLEKQVTVDISMVDVDPSGVRCTVKFKMFLNVPVAGRLISFFAKEKKGTEEKDWQKRLEKDQTAALNPALIQGEAQTMDLDKVKYPYIELSSTSTIYIPYGTKYYPVY